MNVTQFIEWLQKNVDRPDETTIIIEVGDSYYDFDLKSENLYATTDRKPYINSVTISGPR